MKTKAALSLATLALASISLAAVTANAASNNDFNGVVSAVEHHYSAHAQRIHMGLISLCAHAATGGGVKGMRIAEFDHLTLTPEGSATANKNDLDQLNDLVTNTLGSNWHRFVTERDADGSLSLIFVRPDGPAMRMLIADYDHGELDLVRIELNAERMERWIREPQQSARDHKAQNETASLDTSN